MEKADTTGDALPPEGGLVNTKAGERAAKRHDPADERPDPDSLSPYPACDGPKGDFQAKDEQDQRISRSKWPAAAAKKRAELVKILPQAAREYFGNVTLIAYRLNVTEEEVRSASEDSQEVAAAFAFASKLLDALLEDRLTTVALNGNSGTDCRFLLERRLPETYGKPAPQKPGRRSLDLPETGLASAFDPTNKSKQ